MTFLSIPTTERFKMFSAIHLFFIREGQILLLRRFNTGYEDGNYSVPAGHLEGNEEVREAGAREALEETGVSVAPSDIEIVGILHRRSDQERVDWFGIVHDWQGDIYNAEPNKCDDLRWFALDALPQNMVPYVHHALQNYQNGIPFDSFGW